MPLNHITLPGDLNVVSPASNDPLYFSATTFFTVGYRTTGRRDENGCNVRNARESLLHGDSSGTFNQQDFWHQDKVLRSTG